MGNSRFPAKLSFFCCNRSSKALNTRTNKEKRASTKMMLQKYMHLGCKQIYIKIHGLSIRNWDTLRHILKLSLTKMVQTRNGMNLKRIVNAIVASKTILKSMCVTFQRNRLLSMSIFDFLQDIYYRWHQALNCGRRLFLFTIVYPSGRLPRSLSSCQRPAVGRVVMAFAIHFRSNILSAACIIRKNPVLALKL